MSLIKVVTGTENQRECTAKLHVFHSPTDGSAESYLTQLARQGTMKSGAPICVKRGGTNVISAVDNLKEEIGGKWFQQDYDIKDGEILKIFASVKPAWNAMQTVANQFVQVRAGAALIKIKVKLLGMPHSKLAVAELIGRMDLISLAEARAKGCKVNEKYDHTFNDIPNQRLFEIETLEHQVAARPQVQEVTVASEQGESRVIRIKKKGRAIEL